ncbi:hypothetical protein HNR26_003784 [Rhizobium rosettiformans]|uniref:Uncharacterized protein n=2 Tax=Rhizobium rosettiformans TaxID=1368430 RepID=A0A4S8PQ17_9HYPH|nr:hypothetical protein [Rhizobium rosettiformans]MBB5277703.1 hypothetical protein [Rhizobium rosettiformans]THV33087.1 hypothetical protein FAA86_18000 [Rhizobium rosettiformans W3]
MQNETVLAAAEGLPMTRRAMLGALPAAAASVALPVEAAAAEETPVEKVNRLGWELAEALNEYADGRMHAMIFPSDKRKYAVGFCFTDLGTPYGEELATIRDLIDKHRDTFTRWNELCYLADSCDPRYDPAMVPVVEGLDDLEEELTNALIAAPATSYEALTLKAAHLAALDARHGVSYEQASAFLQTFRNPTVRL